MFNFTEKHRPAPTAKIEALCRKIGISRSSWIVEFWEQTDGALIDDQVLIYSVSEIEERNSTFEIYNNFKGMVAVGDDSGGRVILIDRGGLGDIYLVDAGGEGLDDENRFSSLEELLEDLSNEIGEDNEVVGNIVTVEGCKPTLEEIVSIKRMLALDCSSAKLKSMLGEGGAILLRAVYFQRYREALDKLSHVIRFQRK